MNKNIIKTVVASVFITIALAGCGSTSEPIKAQAPTITKAVVLSATDSANGIKSKVSSVEKVVTLTEATDVNNLLGRPNGYTSAAVLYDKVANGSTGPFKCDDPKVGGSPGVTCGATVEVWASENAAKARAAYIQNIGKSHPTMVEYDYLRGNTLLRVTGAMKPSAARQYNAAFGGTQQ
jgi:hypothetical protein